MSTSTLADPIRGSDASRGRCHVYVLPCTWEDHCKIGFSRDPLSRMQALHRRWFEFFDLDAAWLVETETVRDARDLELELRRPLAAHNAPAPLAVRPEAAGHTEWFRGVATPLADAVSGLRRRGHAVHGPLQPPCIASHAACCTWGLMVVATLPPRGSRPVKKSASRRPNSRSSEPLRMGSSARSRPLLE